VKADVQGATPAGLPTFIHAREAEEDEAADCKPTLTRCKRSREAPATLVAERTLHGRRSGNPGARSSFKK